MRHPRAAIAASTVAVCAVAGAAAGIAGSAAAPSTGHSASSGVAVGVAGDGGGFQESVKGPGPLGGKPGVVRIAGGPPIHSQTVIPNRADTGFDTITTDRGKFRSLSGDQLTITEGTQKATYGTVTLTIPSSATVYRNADNARLSDLRDGDEVTVVRGPTGTIVNAEDAQHQPRIAFRSLVGALGKGQAPKLPPPPPVSAPVVPAP